jgi:hypothetical protein
LTGADASSPVWLALLSVGGLLLLLLLLLLLVLLPL